MSKPKTNTEVNRPTTREMRFFVKCPISRVTEPPNEVWQGEKNEDRRSSYSCSVSFGG